MTQAQKAVYDSAKTSLAGIVSPTPVAIGDAVDAACRRHGRPVAGTHSILDGLWMEYVR